MMNSFEYSGEGALLSLVVKLSRHLVRTTMIID